MGLIGSGGSDGFHVALSYCIVVLMFTLTFHLFGARKQNLVSFCVELEVLGRCYWKNFWVLFNPFLQAGLDQPHC